jgi:hypothetical protein
VKAIVADAIGAILLYANEQKVFAKHVKNFRMIPAGLIHMHDVWLGQAR